MTVLLLLQESHTRYETGLMVQATTFNDFGNTHAG